MFNFAPPPGPMPPMQNLQQMGLQAFRPPPPMQMGGAAPAGMQMPQQQAAPSMGGLQQGVLGLANAYGQRPGDPNANGNMSGFPVGGGPMGPSGGAMAGQGTGFWDFLNWLKPKSPLGDVPLTAAGGAGEASDGTGSDGGSGSAAP